MNTIDLKDFGPIISDKETGNRIYDLIKEKNPNSSVVQIDMESIKSMATFCAKQIFGRLYIKITKAEYYNNINPDTIEDNYFSDNFGDKFFDYKNSKLIGHIREDVERRKVALTHKEYAILLTSLIYSIDKIANTVGHFDAYIKKNILYHPLSIQLIRPLDPQCVEIYREDSNILAENITADVAYIDPPYNSRQYSRFYHIYENLVTWEKPELFGVAMKPKAQNMSAYCTSSAPVAFRDLISKLKVKYIVISYNNTYESKSGSSKNKITLEQIKSILEERGTTKIYDCDHRYFNAGKTNFAKHKELLFITEVGQ